jgi:hypothetical protein
VRAGADINLVNDPGRCALDYARAAGNVRCTHFLESTIVGCTIEVLPPAVHTVPFWGPTYAPISGKGQVIVLHKGWKWPACLGGLQPNTHTVRFANGYTARLRLYTSSHVEQCDFFDWTYAEKHGLLPGSDEEDSADESGDSDDDDADADDEEADGEGSARAVQKQQRKARAKQRKAAFDKKFGRFRVRDPEGGFVGYDNRVSGGKGLMSRYSDTRIDFTWDTVFVFDKSQKQRVHRWLRRAYLSYANMTACLYQRWLRDRVYRMLHPPPKKPEKDEDEDEDDEDDDDDDYDVNKLLKRQRRVRRKVVRKMPGRRRAAGDDDASEYSYVSGYSYDYEDYSDEDEARQEHDVVLPGLVAEKERAPFVDPIELRVDKQTGRTYYFNNITKKSAFERASHLLHTPTAKEIAAEKAAAKALIPKDNVEERVQPGSYPPRVYFFNIRTERTGWTREAVADPIVESESEDEVDDDGEAHKKQKAPDYVQPWKPLGLVLAVRERPFPPLEAGVEVDCRWKGLRAWFPATILARHRHPLGAHKDLFDVKFHEEDLVQKHGRYFTHMEQDVNRGCLRIRKDVGPPSKVTVLEVLPGGEAEARGIEVGDLIKAIDGQPPAPYLRQPELDQTIAAVDLRRAQWHADRLGYELRKYEDSRRPACGLDSEQAVTALKVQEFTRSLMDAGIDHRTQVEEREIEVRESRTNR